MNRYLKEFLHRGLMFGGFGPIISGIVFFAIGRSIEDFSLGGDELLLAIVSTYVLAFVQAGASVFNQIEHWSPVRSLAIHMSTLYIVFVGCYLLNSWIPFDWIVVAIFTAVFVVCYLAVWLTVYLCVRASSKRLNDKLKK